MTKISLERPEGILPQFFVAACYCVWENKILLTKRHPEKPEGDTWCLPGGKIEPLETPLKGAQREVFEEVGLSAEDVDLKPLADFFIEKSHIPFMFHVYYLPFKEKPLLNLKRDELTDAVWVSLEEALELPLIAGGEEILRVCEKLRKNLDV